MLVDENETYEYEHKFRYYSQATSPLIYFPYQ